MNLDNNKIDGYIKSNKSDFYNILIKYYIMANAINNRNNDLKTKRIFCAQVIFLVRLILIPVLIAFLIYAYSIKAIIDNNGKTDKEKINDNKSLSILFYNNLHDTKIKLNSSIR
jgi:hypothetical protein